MMMTEKMKETKPLGTEALLQEAKTSEHGEAYRALDKNPNFRIGIGVRLTSPNASSFFIEILIHLFSSLNPVNLKALEKSLTCLKELQARNYSLTGQDDNCISCETTKPAQNIAQEYAAVKSLLKQFLTNKP
jgi:hypothetical protein